MPTLIQSKEISKTFYVGLLKISSPVFKQHGIIPEKYTSDGRNINPPLHIEDIPIEARSLVIVLEDIDAKDTPRVHWISWNLPVSSQLKENNSTGIMGLNDYGKFSYNGPALLTEKHNYFFKVYALDCLLNVPAGSFKSDLDDAMNGHVIANGILAASY